LANILLPFPAIQHPFSPSTYTLIITSLGLDVDARNKSDNVASKALTGAMFLFGAFHFDVVPDAY
jgi:hypothetical protein